MKTELTKEESQHLIDLGVPKEKASGIITENDAFIYSIDGGYVTEGGVDYPIFKLEDLLNGKAIPKEIEIPVFYDGLEEPEYYTKYRIAFEWDSNNFQETEPQYNAFYKEIAFVPGGYLAKFSSEELIDALYELTCWYYGEYLKSEKK